MNIAFAGLTAAGKTTHARLLAEHLGYRYVSATEIMLDILGLRGYDLKRVWFNHMDEIEKARSGDQVDEELEARLLALAESENGLLLDSWAMAWICPTPVIRIWIDSDRLSRHWKCFVSQGAKSQLSLVECAELIDRKDSTTQQSFLRRHNFDLFSDHGAFDAILTNTWMIDSPTQAAANRGIKMFEPVLQTVVEHLLQEEPQCDFERALTDLGPIAPQSIVRLGRVD
jgi:cytidylate kinase